MLLIRFIAFLFGGLVLTLIGYYLRKEKKFLGFTFMILGLFLIYTITIGPLSKSKDRILAITNIDSVQVKNIKLLPSHDNPKRTINTEIIINDRDEINQLCKGLNGAVEEGEGFLKSPEWQCIIVVELNSNEQLKFGVNRIDEVTGLNVSSNGESGWHYGNLRADEFGRRIGNIVK
ncbi:MAG: hypothetical protein IPO86_00115 [Saprospiraceae bacterium]|nr:hypothetical protein [Saprospiraceae bacterium]MBK9726500.1 hypothetical protein [Saprospiraceae bacterium]